MDNEAAIMRSGCFLMGARRGHGVHSPFAYSLIRRVWGPESGGRRDLPIHPTLSTLGINRKTAGRIERLYRACGCENIAAKAEGAAPRTLFLALENGGPDNALALKEAAANRGGVLCIIKRGDRLWRELCRRISDGHDGMVIESRSLAIIFTDKTLNKQHIRL